MVKAKWNIIFVLFGVISQLLAPCFATFCNLGNVKTNCLDEIGDNPTCDFIQSSTSLSHQLKDDYTADYVFKFLSLKNACGFDRNVLDVDYLSYATSAESCMYRDNADSSAVHRFWFETSENCSKVEQEFCMKYFFKGCYAFTISPYTGESSHRPVTHYIWIENNYTLKDFKLDPPTFDLISLNPFEVSWKFKPKTFVDNEKSFSTSLENSDGNRTLMTNYCSLTNQTVICQLNNVTTDKNSKLIFDLNDQYRCYLNKFYEVCKWSSPPLTTLSLKTPSEYKFEIPLRGQLKYLDWILVAVLVIIFTIILIAILWYKKFKSGTSSNFFTEIYPRFETRKSVKGILLLYARDCIPFMETMAELRRYLISRTKSKVYDIFDNNLFDKIATSPHEFIESLLQDPQINVIVISTECFEQLYQSMLQYFSNHSNRGNEVFHLNQLYKSPHWLDGLVLHALKLISYDTSATSYKKFYVARLPKFNGSGNYLMHLNPCTRFDLPGGLDTLIEKVSYSNQENGLMNSIQSRESLHRALYNLNSFVLNKPDYLYSDILKSNETSS